MTATTAEHTAATNSYVLAYAERTSSGWVPQFVEPNLLPPPVGGGGCGMGLPRRMTMDDPPLGGNSAGAIGVESPGGVEAVPTLTLQAAGRELQFTLPEAEAVTLTLFDAAGRRIDRQVVEHGQAGLNRFEWSPGKLSGGIYFVRLQTSGGRTASARWVYLN